MATTAPNFFTRLIYSLAVFFRFIFDGNFGTQVLEAWKGDAKPLPPPPAPEPKPVVAAPKPPDSASALHLLAILQREGRFVDFLQEDIGSFGDADVGAAARVVHDGCRKVLKDYLTIEPLRTEGEGAQIVVPSGFDPAAIRLTGQVTGQPPFKGALRHHGWKAAQVRLPPPPANVDPSIVAPAEVEL